MAKSIREIAAARLNQSNTNTKSDKIPEDFYLNIGLTLNIDGEDKFVSLTGTGVSWIKELSGDSTFAKANRALVRALKDKMELLDDGETTKLAFEVELRKVDHNASHSDDGDEFNIQL